MKAFIKVFIIITGTLLFATGLYAQKPPTWTSKELMQPAQPAGIINSKKENIIIVSVGPSATILHSTGTGMAGEKEGLEKFKAYLSSLNKDKEVVIYCGCCPFDHCPNVRPAIAVLRQMKFTHFYLLNLPDNIKKNWIDKGYPVAKL